MTRVLARDLPVIRPSRAVARFGGQRVAVYRYVEDAGILTIREVKTNGAKGAVLARVRSAAVTHAQFWYSEKGYQQFLSKCGDHYQFAEVRGILVAAATLAGADTRIYMHPFERPDFHRADNGRPVRRADAVIIRGDGMWAARPR